MNFQKFLFLVLAAFIASDVTAQIIPADPLVRNGKLANGFTYYIRHNDYPQKHVELYLVNKVGSVLEDDDQRGLAHFMEHMNFNGTKHYPKNDLIDFLQKAGVRFGADLNAYTGFDETVYQLPIPTDQTEMFTAGLGIMRDWAQDATLDPVEIDHERGIVLEEERLGKGAKDRISRQTLPLMLNHARYADRVPIGKDEILTTFKPEVIKRFHHDWYRPDLQAIIIVGDVDINEAEALVKAKFSDLKNPPNERQRTNYTVPLTGKTQFVAVTDKEQSSTTLEVVMKHKATELKTQQDYQVSMQRNLLNLMLDARRNAQLSRNPDPAYTGVSFGIQHFISNVDAFEFAVSAKEGRLAQAFKQGWNVLIGLKRFGFTQQELDRAKVNYLSNLQRAVAEEGKTPSVDYVKEYQRLFLNGEASPGIEWEYQFSKEHLPDISLGNITSLMNEYLASKDVDMILTAPEKDKNRLPDSATVNQWKSISSKEELVEWKDDNVDNSTLLTKPPVPGKVIGREEIPQIGVTKITLSNGITVIMKPTEFKNDQILYGAFGPGGTSLYDGVDFDVANNAGPIMSNMGLGRFNSVQLSQALTGKVVSSGANIGPRNETITAKASTTDLETALQLTYLQFTAPRKDSLIFKNSIDNGIATLAGRHNDPNTVFLDTINYIMTNRSYRSAVPTPERWRKMSLQRTYEIYQERFANAADFTFVFVGNFNVDSILPLLERYLGSLPSTGKHTEARDLGIHIPQGQLVKKVYKGSENKAIVRIVLSGELEYSPEAILQLRALSEVLQIKVLQRLREAESEVYSPQVQSVFNKYPQKRFATVIQFGCAPKNVDHLVELLDQEIQSLREHGPENDDLTKFKAQYEKTLELGLKDNSFWYTYLLNQYESKENVLQVQDIKKNLDKIDSPSLKKAAKVFFSKKNKITFELLPESQTN